MLSEDVFTVFNGTFNISCYAEGNPLPSVIWYKNNIQYDIKNRSITLMSSFSLISTLMFTKISSDDFAHYDCSAVNSVGSSTRSSTVELLEPSKYASILCVVIITCIPCLLCIVNVVLCVFVCIMYMHVLIGCSDQRVGTESTGHVIS